MDLGAGGAAPPTGWITGRRSGSSHRAPRTDGYSTVGRVITPPTVQWAGPLRLSHASVVGQELRLPPGSRRSRRPPDADGAGCAPQPAPSPIGGSYGPRNRAAPRSSMLPAGRPPRTVGVPMTGPRAGAGELVMVTGERVPVRRAPGRVEVSVTSDPGARPRPFTRSGWHRSGHLTIRTAKPAGSARQRLDTGSEATADVLGAVTLTTAARPRTRAVPTNALRIPNAPPRTPPTSGPRT